MNQVHSLTTSLSQHFTILQCAREEQFHAGKKILFSFSKWCQAQNLYIEQ